MPRWKANLILFIIALIWGPTFILTKHVLLFMGPLGFLACRLILASLILVIIYRKLFKRLTREELLGGMVLGIVLGLCFVAQFVGLKTTTAGKSGFITSLYVVMVPIFSMILFKHMIKKHVAIGVVLATIGLGLLSLNHGLNLESGDLWTLGCAALSAIYIILVTYYSRSQSQLKIAILQIVTAAILASIGALVLEPLPKTFPHEFWIILVYSSIFATAFAFPAQMKVQAYTTPTTAALLFSLEAVFAAFFGWLLGGELMTPRQIYGCVLIFAGVILAQIQVKRKLLRKVHELEP